MCTYRWTIIDTGIGIDGEDHIEAVHRMAERKVDGRLVIHGHGTGSGQQQVLFGCRAEVEGEFAVGKSLHRIAGREIDLRVLAGHGDLFPKELGRSDRKVEQVVLSLGIGHHERKGVALGEVLLARLDRFGALELLDLGNRCVQLDFLLYRTGRLIRRTASRQGSNSCDNKQTIYSFHNDVYFHIPLFFTAIVLFPVFLPQFNRKQSVDGS